MAVRTVRVLAAWAGLIALTGCALGPAPAEPADGLPVSSALNAAPPVTRWGRAATPLPDGPSLGDYLECAAQNNPGLQAAFERWVAALERVPQATALPDPRVSYRYYFQEVETRVGPQEQAVGLSQTFPWFGKLALRGSVAAAEADAARARFEAARLRLFYDVSRAYYDHYYLARSIAVVEATRDLMTYLEEVARTRYKAAATPYADVVRAQVELGKLDDRLRALRDMRKPLAARLNAALSRPVGAPIPWPEQVSQDHVAASDEELLNWLAELNPELMALAREAAGREHAIALARKDYYPDITVGLDYIQTGHARMSGVSGSGEDPIIGMVSVNLPIWREKYRAGEREARARHRAAMRAREDRRNLLSSELQMALYNLRDAERKIDLYRDTLVPKARQSLRATETAFRAGKAGFLDLVDGQRVLLEFQLAYERALTDHAQRVAELEMLVGRKVAAGPAGPEAQAAADDPEAPGRTVRDPEKSGQEGGGR